MPDELNEALEGSASASAAMGAQIVPEGTTLGDDGLPVGNPVVAEARRRFEWCAEWESTWRTRFLDDYRFENADSENGYQWPNSIRRNRQLDSRPCLTLNITKQHNLQISNEARKAKASSKILPLGNAATVEGALAYNNLIRRIESHSNAQSIYTVARDFQIGPGLGWWRLVTDWASNTSFDQEIFLRPVNDPLAVYMDPGIKQFDGSDANYAFVFDEMPKEQFDEAWPEWKDRVGGMSPLGVGTSDDWITAQHVRVCEYFRRVARPDTLISFVWEGQRHTVLRSNLPDNVAKEILEDPLTKTRPTSRLVVEWYLIAGNQIIDQTLWPGKYIPLIRCVGREFILDGIMDRVGHTRAQKDAQRMYNYNASAQVEFVALQAKTPWVAAAQAIEEYEQYWNSANIANYSVLPYNGLDDEGNPIPAPQRAQPPTASPAYQAGMDTAFNQLMMVSGQWQNQMGMMGNERTGAAIGKRMQQGETATYHFQDNYEMALRFSAQQLLDLIPKVYNTRRVFMVQGENDVVSEMVVDPSAAQAVQMARTRAGEMASLVFNPNIGEYGVDPSFGPAYGSKREETSEALTLILTQAPDLVPVLGDLLVGSMDFDKAQEAAQRLRRLVPPVALGQGPSQQEQLLGGQVQALRNALTQSLQKQAKGELKLVGKEQMRDIDAYKAETDRLDTLKDFLPTDAEGLRQVIGQLIEEALKNTLTPIVEANANNIDIDGQGAPKAPAPGAQQAPDGQWYVADPTRPGKYLKALPRASAGAA